MNREIKFRAWDKGKRLFIPNDVYAVITTDFNAFGVMLKDWEDYKEGEYFYENAQELMQYTGLKDNNDKEIYEGDIIQDKDGLRYTVEYRGTEFCKVNLTSTNLFDSSTYLQIEVIGNIYETPHLLNNEQEAQESDTTKISEEAKS